MSNIEFILFLFWYVTVGWSVALFMHQAIPISLIERAWVYLAWPIFAPIIAVGAAIVQAKLDGTHRKTNNDIDY